MASEYKNALLSPDDGCHYDQVRDNQTSTRLWTLKLKWTGHFRRFLTEGKSPILVRDQDQDPLFHEMKWIRIKMKLIRKTTGSKYPAHLLL